MKSLSVAAAVVVATGILLAADIESSAVLPASNFVSICDYDLLKERLTCDADTCDSLQDVRFLGPIPAQIIHFHHITNWVLSCRNLRADTQMTISFCTNPRPLVCDYVSITCLEIYQSPYQVAAGSSVVLGVVGGMLLLILCFIVVFYALHRQANNNNPPPLHIPLQRLDDDEEEEEEEDDTDSTQDNDEEEAEMMDNDYIEENNANDAREAVVEEETEVLSVDCTPPSFNTRSKTTKK